MCYIHMYLLITWKLLQHITGRIRRHLHLCQTERQDGLICTETNICLFFCLFSFWGFGAFLGVFCFQIWQETVKILLSGLLPLLQKGEVHVRTRENNISFRHFYIRGRDRYLQHHDETIILIAEPHLFLHFLRFLTLSISLEEQI